MKRKIKSLRLINPNLSKTLLSDKSLIKLKLVPRPYPKLHRAKRTFNWSRMQTRAVMRSKTVEYLLISCNLNFLMYLKTLTVKTRIIDKSTRTSPSTSPSR